LQQVRLSGTIERLESRYPYRVRVLVIKTDKEIELEIEVPEKLIEEADLDLKEGARVDIVLSQEKSREVLESEIAYSGEVYKVRDKEVLISFGGILAKLSGDLPAWLREGVRVYLGLKVPH